MKPNKKLLTFQEKVQPLSKDEQGLLKGGFTEVGTPDANSLIIRNGSCDNENCTTAAKNKIECRNKNCKLCSCKTDPYNPWINQCIG